MTATPRTLRPAPAGHAQPPDGGCVHCGSALATPYCAACGEQRASDRHYTLVHFAEEAFETFTHADGRLWRSLTTLVAHPGVLTVAYMQGRRKAYIAPLQLFLILNVVLFIAAAIGIGGNTFNTPLSSQMHLVHHSATVTRLVVARLAARHTTLAAYTPIFDHATTTLAKSLVITMVPALALATAIIVLPRRRFAVQHLVFALHAMGMLFIIGTVVTAVVIGGMLVLGRVAPWLRSPSFDAIATTAVLLWFGAYMAAALRRAYGFGWIGGTVRAVVTLAAVANILELYRILLFYATFWTT